MYDVLIYAYVCDVMQGRAGGRLCSDFWTSGSSSPRMCLWCGFFSFAHSSTHWHSLSLNNPLTRRRAK